MRNTIIAAAALVTSAAAQPTVDLKTLWLDTVKRGEMTRQVRALGEIAGARQADIRVAETQIADVRKGQPVSIETSSRQTLSGVVQSIGSSAHNGVIVVQVALKALPTGHAIVRPPWPHRVTVAARRRDHHGTRAASSAACSRSCAPD